MSFDLYFAGASNAQVRDLMIDRHSCKLYSQLRDRRSGQFWLDFNKENPGDSRKVFVDSGAFSAWSKGKSIDTDEYIDYINTNTNELILFASVDNIPGELTRTPTLKEKQQSPLLSWENYMYMRERVKEPDKLLPVFHIGEDFKYLDNICNVILDGKHIPYIALGGTVGLERKIKDNWYKQCFKIIKQSNNPNVKTHAFGMTSLNILESYPFTSADSTSWIMTAATGHIYTDYGTICVSSVSQDKPNHLLKLPKETQQHIEAQVNKYGVSIEECMEQGNARTIVNVNFLQDWADNYQYKGNNRYQKRLF